MNQTKLHRIKSALRESIEATDWLSNHNARTMTPLACKALLTAIEGLELIHEQSPLGEYSAWDTLSSITSEWPDV